MRIGQGYDVHRLVEGRPLFLGGVEIPFEKGLDGHSDADALLHALCDALLGAAAMGDIGRHFPDTDPAYKNIASVTLLEKTWALVEQHCSEIVDHEIITPKIVNIDVTIFAQAPKIAPWADRMKERIAAVLPVLPNRVNIKATTTEGLGPVGRGEGIAAMCVVLLDCQKD